MNHHKNHDAVLLFVLANYLYQQLNKEKEDNPVHSVLEQKSSSLKSLLQEVLSQIQSTKTLENILLKYLDMNIVKVENHLLQIDFWQNHHLHRDVIQLRNEMQQQLFQLEREKVHTRIQLNSHVIQLSKEARTTAKELENLNIHFNFLKENG